MRSNFLLLFILRLGLLSIHWLASAQTTHQAQLALYQDAFNEAQISQAEFNYHRERLQIK